MDDLLQEFLTETNESLATLDVELVRFEREPSDAKILGNIEVGHCARIAAGSVVLKAVPNNTTVAGMPARVVGTAGCAEPSRTMDQMLYDQGP